MYITFSYTSMIKIKNLKSISDLLLKTINILLLLLLLDLKVPLRSTR